MASRGVGLSVLVLLALFETGLCLKCYKCTNPGTPGCGSPFSLNSDDLRECSDDDVDLSFLNNFPLFLKVKNVAGKLICAKIVANTNEGAQTLRTCIKGEKDLLNEVCKAAVMEKENNSDQGFCGFCDSDGCNGSSYTVASIPVALLSLVATCVLGRSLT